MDMYKAILLSIIEPVAEIKPDRLRQMAYGSSYPQVSEMLLRTAKFLEMSIALAQEQQPKTKEVSPT